MYVIQAEIWIQDLTISKQKCYSFQILSHVAID